MPGPARAQFNLLRLIKAGKKAVPFNAGNAKATNSKTLSDWEAFLADCGGVVGLPRRGFNGFWGNRVAVRP